MHPIISDSLRSLAVDSPLTPAAVARLVPLLEKHRLDIYALARLAAAKGGTRAFTCGIINAKSGRCAEDCSFCAQSARHETHSPVYGLLSDDLLLKRAELLAASGARYMGIVISGAASTDKDFAKLCEAARKIAARVPIRLCASFGLLTLDQAKTLKEAGYASYHHNLESARSWYGKICNTHSYDRRLETARNASLAGLRLCCGGIFGLGEGWAERLELARCLAELGVDSIPLNFLIPVKGTPLEGQALLPPQEALDCIAVMRLINPQKDILVCGGRAATLGAWAQSLFFAGANGMMIGDYLTTKGSVLESDLEMLAVLGLS